MTKPLKTVICMRVEERWFLEWDATILLGPAGFLSSTCLLLGSNSHPKSLKISLKYNDIKKREKSHTITIFIHQCDGEYF